MSHFDPETIDVLDFLECLELENLSVRGDEAWFSCPFPGHANGDMKPSASMNVETTQFFCLGCKARGNAISFTERVLGVSPLEAIRMLRARYQPGGLNPDSVSMVEVINGIINAPPQTEIPQPQLDDTALYRFATDWFEVERARNRGEEIDPIFLYMFDRGFGPEVLGEWEFGYDPLSHRITLPVRDEHGVLIGFKARAHDGRQPKYLVLGDKPNQSPRYGWPCYFTSRVCFGAHRLTGDCEVVVCEGELNAIAVVERTGRPAVAINGSHFSEFHARIIRRHASRAILFLDDDNAGCQAVWGWNDSTGKHRPGIVEQLEPFIPVLIAPPSEKDAAELSGEEISGILADSASALVQSLERC